MAIETTTNIPGLNQAYPLATDGLGEGDDHIRMIKRILKTTFPSIDKPLTVSADQINAVVGNPFPFPVGAIVLWSGSITSIPTGWALCNGVTVNRSDGSGTITPPNLRDRFIVGAGTTYAQAATGGTSSHTHTVTIAGTALTTAQIPEHTHTITDPGHTHDISDPGHTHTVFPGYTGGGGPTRFYDGAFYTPDQTLTTSNSKTGISVLAKYTGITVNNAGGGQTHTHTNTVDTVNHLPPYFALAYIMKI